MLFIWKKGLVYHFRLKIDFFKISTSQKKVANRQICIQATLDPEANQDGNDKMTTASVNATQKAADMKWWHLPDTVGAQNVSGVHLLGDQEVVLELDVDLMWFSLQVL